MNPTGGAGAALDFHLLEQTASSYAQRADALFTTMLVLCGAMALLLAGFIVVFAIRYRRGSKANRDAPPSNARGLEAAWTIAPMLLFIAIFFWAANDYAALVRMPADAMPVFVIGKQWMWKLQHANGRREIDELHVPIGRPVRLVMTSEDVIHSFGIPALRIKRDVVPGRYNELWFKADRLGDFRIFCSEYCGARHSSMIGRLVVMEPAAYARWLGEAGAGTDLEQRGYALFRDHGCSGCHAAGASIHAPLLDGVYGRTVHLEDGRSLIADENYLRDSILRPRKDVVAGYEPLMPSYQGQLGEEDVAALVAYLRSLRFVPSPALSGSRAPPASATLPASRNAPATSTPAASAALPASRRPAVSKAPR